MLSFIATIKNRVYRFFEERIESPFFFWWLAAISFTESIILPLPTAAFLMAIFLAGAKRWFYYAMYTTLFSVLGGIVGYFLGLLFFDTLGIKIIDFYHLQEELSHVQGLYDDNAFWVTLVGAFTPVPYKIFVLTAGFLKANFVAFLIASIIGRGAQFYLIAVLMRKYGETVTKVFLTYFNYIALIGILLAVLVLR